MIYRKPDVKVAPELFPVLASILSEGARMLLFEELEVFAGTENKSLYRSSVSEGEIIYEIGVGGALRAFVGVNEKANIVYLLDVEMW